MDREQVEVILKLKELNRQTKAVARRIEQRIRKAMGSPGPAALPPRARENRAPEPERTESETPVLVGPRKGKLV